MDTVVDKYEERLQTMSDSDLTREWHAETGNRLRQIEHEMAMRFQKPRLLNYLNKFLDMPEQFIAACDAKDWFHAKYIYDTAIRVCMFLEIPVPLRNEVFGISAEDEEEIQGMFPRDLVGRVYDECVFKDKLGHECVVYRIPGEIGFYGAKVKPGTRPMSAEENPSFWIQEEPVVVDP